MHVVISAIFEFFGTLQSEKEGNLPNQDWAVFVGSPRPAILQFDWLRN